MTVTNQWTTARRRRWRPLAGLTINSSSRLADLREDLEAEEAEMDRRLAYDLARAELEALMVQTRRELRKPTRTGKTNKTK